MIVEDKFNIAGGPCFVGKVESGCVTKGDRIECRTRKGKFSATVAQLEQFRKSINQAHAGQNIGICLCDYPSEQLIGLDRGDILSSPDQAIARSLSGPSPSNEYQEKILAIESLIPTQFQAKIRLLRKRLPEMSMTATAQARDELESENTARQRVWGDQVQQVRLHLGNADATYRALLTCLAADFSKGAFDMGIEEVPVATGGEASVVKEAVDKLSIRYPRVASDPGLRAFHEKKLVKRLRKHRQGSCGSVIPAAFRKVTVKVHFRGAVSTFGTHHILRVDEDCYDLMPCADYER
jgi:hypothetical protein